MTHEEYVRARWERVIVCDGSYGHYAKGTILLNWANHQFYEFKDFSAVRAFTEQCEREIAEVQEAICLLKGWRFVVQGQPTALGILKREQAVLAELRRGMKEGSE